MIRGRRELVLPAFLAATVLLAGFRLGPRTFDDAYITFRYARNLARGAGLVYNPGERVIGTSAPLFATLLAGISTVTGSRDFPVLAFAIGILSTVLLVFMGWFFLRRFVSPLFAAAALLLALANGVTLWILASGLETPLYLLGILGCLHLVARRSDLAALLLAGVLPFLHPEALLLFPALSIGIRVRDGRWPLAPALIAAAPPTVLSVLMVLVYGSPVTHSVIAKSHVVVSVRLAASAAFMSLAKSALFPFDLLGDVPRDPTGAVTGAKALTYLVAAGLLAIALRGFWKLRRDGTVVALTLFVATYGLMFAAFNPLLFPWYFPPFRLALALLLAISMGRVAEATDRWRAVAWVWAGVAIGTAAIRLTSFQPYDPGPREGLYRHAVEELSLGDQDLVAAPEIGAVGYFSDARILDTVGLVSPAILSSYDATWRQEVRRGLFPGDIPPRLFRTFHPDYIVSAPWFLQRSLTLEPDMLSDYERIAFHPDARSLGGGVVVYRRRKSGGIPR